MNKQKFSSTHCSENQILVQKVIENSTLKFRAKIMKVEYLISLNFRAKMVKLNL